ncbi:Transposable element Tc1 transposase [Araneus ventricosus]|uniref:Transposable element Tc1 transposase n=1 Tax=Araneus ventricosus TaxID=182803 RepID=A0A4Y2KH97_ARAVE|nr:Transposable element Tc1 transposase [Araneus ventricosus]GBN00967.1 Transposable element Tc1 transposase [Araneus ventricosus]
MEWKTPRSVEKPIISSKNPNGKMPFGVMKAKTYCLVRMGYSGFVVPKALVSTPKYQIPTTKHGRRNVMVWGCVSRLGMGPLRWIQGIMDKFKYEDILENIMRPYALNSLRRGFIVQQDNYPKHRSKHIQNWFSRRHVTLLDWSSQSPDFNIIERVWAELERCVLRRNARNADEKFSQLEEEWKKIPLSFIQTLLDSMPHMCQAIIDAKGFATKY